MYRHHVLLIIDELIFENAKSAEASVVHQVVHRAFLAKRFNGACDALH